MMLVWTKSLLRSLDHAPTELFTLVFFLFLCINYLPLYFHDNLLYTDTYSWQNLTLRRTPPPTAPLPPLRICKRVKINLSRVLAIRTVNSRHARCLLVVLLITDYFDFVYKAFYALLEYSIGRKRKAVRISKALEERRNRLLRAGVTRWMKVAFTTICLVLGLKSL